MAFTTGSATETRAFSLGPVRMEIQTFSALTSDTSGTITAQRLSRVDDVLVMGLGSAALTAPPSISGTTVTLSMADPSSAVTGYAAKAINGYIILLGR